LRIGVVFKELVGYGFGMNGIRLAGCGILAGMIAGAAVRAEVTEAGGARYKLIIDRNMFNLVDPPPAPKVTPPPTNPPTPPLKILLSGISVGPRGKFAWLVVPPTPGKTNLAQYWKVREGEQQGDVKVLQVNPGDRTVKVENGGITAVLDLAKDAPAVVGPAVVPGMPAGVPGRPGVVPGRPGVAQAIPIPNPAVGAAGRPTPYPATGQLAGQPGSRSSMASPAVRGVTANPALGGGAPSLTVGSPGATASFPGSRTIPARPMRTETPPPELQDPAAQWLLMRAQEEQASRLGIPHPPTPPEPPN
jgi:hypothetical protein